MATAKKKVEELPEGAIVVDVDEQSRARAEVSDRKPVYIKFKDELYQLNTEIPLSLILGLGDLDEKDAAATGKFAVEAIKTVLGDKGWKKFVASGATVPDMYVAFNAAFAAITGVTPGEASASPAPSTSTGTRPRQRSKPVTASTS